MSKAYVIETKKRETYIYQMFQKYLMKMYLVLEELD